MWIGLVRGRLYVLEVRGRTSGRTISLGEVALVWAMRRHHCVVREFPIGMRPPLLKAYLDSFATEVQRFIPVPKGSAVESFIDLASRYPVFEPQPIDGSGVAPR